MVLQLGESCEIIIEIGSIVFSPPLFRIFYATMPVYLAEVTPKDSRGLLTSMIGPGYGLGFMVSLFTWLG